MSIILEYSYQILLRSRCHPTVEASFDLTDLPGSRVQLPRLSGSCCSIAAFMANSHLSKSLVGLERGQEEFDHAYSDCAQYGRVSFWDEMYANETEPFEWYYPYHCFRAQIRKVLSTNQRILVAGCGSSNFLEDMATDGFEQLEGCDFSRVALNQMRARCSDLPQIKLHLANLTDTDFPNEHFQGIIDKAVFDSILCTEDGATKVRQYINEVERMLTDTGVFILISHNNPEEMLKYLEQYDIDEPYYSPWTIEVQTLSKAASFLHCQLAIM